MSVSLTRFHGNGNPSSGFDSLPVCACCKKVQIACEKRWMLLLTKVIACSTEDGQSKVVAENQLLSPLSGLL